MDFKNCLPPFFPLRSEIWESIHILENREVFSNSPTTSFFRRERRSQEVETAKVIKNRGVKLASVAKLLGISCRTLYKQYRRGELRAVLAHATGDVGHGCLVVQRDEVDRLKREYRVNKEGGRKEGDG